ncbi:MAG: UDP-N-acetylmuramoyl-L-alanine--D-glutamate ligase [Rhodospirillaceae bacterium]|jgi:UDP-N-acetylmuramoylalanine--D-glutamate ligase|nr:UDP-N-acetylmuramoyl-L-alanine--D-glutamate ligase [Rhodospirillaceae bacterium]
MIPITAYRDKRVAVFGLGRTGLSVAQALLAGGARVLVWDDEPNRRLAAVKIGAEAAAPSPETWKGIAALVLSPGVPLTHPRPHMVVGLADRLGAEILGDVELFARTRPAAAIAAVTGTNGKSTTTSLLGHILSSAGRAVEVGANLGRPVLDFDVLAAAGVYVLELSSYQIDLTKGLRPQVVAMLNISPDHLDRHGGMDGYVAAKRRLLEMACPDATLVIGSDDEWSARMCQAMRAAGRKVVEISTVREVADGIFAHEGGLYRAGTDAPTELVADLNGMETLRGAHNWQNAAVAFAVAVALGLTTAQIAPALADYPGLPHRLEVVARQGDVVFVNDSKATNAEAAAHALAAYERIYWIAGGIAKQGGIASLTPYFPNVARAFLIGEAASDFARGLGQDLDHEISGDLATAVRAAHAAALSGTGATAGGVILLSPACASFDQFASFEDRGDQFRDLARDLAGQDGGNGNGDFPRRAVGGAR